MKKDILHIHFLYTHTFLFPEFVNIPLNLIPFFFSTKKSVFYLKNTILCLFLKNVSPSKKVICFILNYSQVSMVEGIAFYALYKSRVLIISCKADDSCLFLGLQDEIYKNAPGIVIQF